MCCTFRDQLNWMQHRFCPACTFTFWEINACKAKIHRESSNWALAVEKHFETHIFNFFPPFFPPFLPRKFPSPHLMSSRPSCPCGYLPSSHGRAQRGQALVKAGTHQTWCQGRDRVDRVDRGPGPLFGAVWGCCWRKALICEMFFFTWIYGDWCPVGIYIKWLTWKRICENMGWVQFARWQVALLRPGRVHLRPMATS